MDNKRILDNITEIADLRFFLILFSYPFMLSNEDQDNYLEILI